MNDKSFHAYFLILIVLVCGAIYLMWTRMEKPVPINQAQFDAIMDSLKASNLEKQALKDSLALTVENNARQRAVADSIHLLSITAILEYKGLKVKNKKELDEFKQLPLDEQAEFWKNSVLGDK